MEREARQDTCELVENISPDGPRGTYHAALAGLQEYRISREHVRRVAVTRKGEIHIEIHRTGRQRHFVYQSGRLREIHAAKDRKIPFSSKLNESGPIAPRHIVSYRPTRRMVVEVESSGRKAMVKAYRKHNTVVAREKYTIVQSALANGGFHLPALLDADLDAEYLLMEKRAGHVPPVSRGAVHTWREIGACLRQFQDHPAAGGLQEFTWADELAVLDERARRFQLCLPDLPDDWMRGREQLGRLASSLPSPQNGLAHRDLHDRQMIVGDQDICLLDFDLLCIADVALDAANLMAHMKLRTMQTAEREVSALQACRESFLKGMDRQEVAGFEHRLLFYGGCTFLRLALLYALRPCWNHLTPALIAEGRNWLRELEKTQAGE